MTHQERLTALKRANTPVRRDVTGHPTKAQLFDRVISQYTYCGTSFVGQLMKHGHVYKGL